MPKKIYKCVVSGKVIPPERIEALKSLGTPEQMWTCVEYSLAKPKQALFLGEVGTSELLIVDKVYDDSVRSVFRSKQKNKPVGEDEVDEDLSTGNYNKKELDYYSSDDEQVDPEEKIDIVKRQNS